MSSILEISERQLVDSTPEDGYLRSSSQQSSSHSALNIPATELARSGFFTVLDVAVEYQVPYISIKQIGLPNSFEPQGIHYGYSVGTGYSARVVRHLTEHDVGQIKQGTVVALKQYLPKDATFGQEEGETENTVFQAVRREIKALCHPRLRNHENVCRVLYVGWHNKSIYPILALELATYGTLEDAMTAPGIGLSWLQKINITIDIISAIQVVHSVSMIHGDIKPGNVILQHHETRQVVAKIIDLAGSRDLYDDCDLEFRPGMGTEIWAPPEVCLGSPNVNWYKADAYSLGLLIASMWARPPTWAQRKLDSCILERFVPRNMSKKEKQDRLIILKTHTDLNIQGVMQQCWSDVPCINPIILTTLSADASWRLDGTKLGSLMLSMLCWKVPRTVPSLGDSPGVSRNAPGTFTVWSANFVNSSRDVHDMVFSRLHAESAPIRRLIGHISLRFVPSIESQATDAECIIQRAYICLKTLEDTVKKQFGLQAASCGLPAYEYALCHYLGLGTSHSLEVFNDHINAAALSGYYTDFHLSLVAKTTPPDDAVKSLRALFLVIGAIVGKKTAICSLKYSFPELHRSTLHSLSLRREISGHRKTSASSGLVQWLKEAADLPISNPSLFTLKECFETHNCQGVSEILATGDFDASITFGGIGIFHYLTYLEDTEAAALATMCLERGGALAHRAPDNSWTCLKTTNTPPSQTALAWAWAYGMDRYFDELLKLHLQKAIPITDYHILLWSASEHFDHKSLKKLLQLVDTHPHLLNQGSDWLPLQAKDHDFRQMPLNNYLQVCASACLSDRATGSVLDWHLLSRIEHHGMALTEARLQTLKVFLDRGVDVASYLGLCLHSDDAASCDLLCATLNKKGPTDLSPLSRLLHSSIHGHNMNDVRTHNIEGAPRSFNAILSHFPQLAAQSATYPPCFLPPLCTAAIVKDSSFARRLLEIGADLDAEYDNNSALAVALVHGNLETAELIYNHMSQEQRRRAFDGHPITGFTMTGRLIGFWVRKRDLVLRDALTWLRRVDGASPLSNEKSNIACWSVILTGRPPPLQEHISRDSEILRMLFKWFPEQTKSCTSNGYMPIHWAARHGLVGVMKVLVSLGADINAEVPAVEGATYPGRTALNIAILLKLNLEENIPKDIADGGASEVKRWRQRCRDTLDYLNSMNAKSGSQAIEAEQYMAIFDQVTHQSSGRVQYHIPESSQEAGSKSLQSSERVAWPAILKPDHTSPPPWEVPHTKNWMKAYCQNSQRLVLVRRHLVFNYLHGDFYQPRAGHVSRPPDAYSSWLAQMSTARKSHWARTNLPTDTGFSPPSSSLSLDEFKEWHLHGWSPLGSNMTIERLPRYRLISFLGRPLQSDSQSDKEMSTFLQALHDNCLDADDLAGPNAILVDNEVIGAGSDEALSKLQEVQERPGKGLRFYLILTGKDGEVESYKQLAQDMGWDKIGRIEEGCQ